MNSVNRGLYYGILGIGKVSGKRVNPASSLPHVIFGKCAGFGTTAPLPLPSYYAMAHCMNLELAVSPSVRMAGTIAAMNVYFFLAVQVIGESINIVLHTWLSSTQFSLMVHFQLVVVDYMLHMCPSQDMQALIPTPAHCSCLQWTLPS